MGLRRKPGEPLLRHGRIRKERGMIKQFSDLPAFAQKTFRKIAAELKERGGIETLFVFGSFLWGFWDDESDFDVMTLKNKKTINIPAFKQRMLEEFKIKVDIVNMNRDLKHMNYIKIE